MGSARGEPAMKTQRSGAGHPVGRDRTQAVLKAITLRVIWNRKGRTRSGDVPAGPAWLPKL